MRIVLDPLFPPVDLNHAMRNSAIDLCPENKFELIFDERVDGPKLAELFNKTDKLPIIGSGEVIEEQMEKVVTLKPSMPEICIDLVSMQNEA